MSIFKKRGELLSDRLGLIGTYLIGPADGKPFDVFLRERNITRDDFIKGLPEKFRQPPVKKEEVIEYGKAMNNEFYDAYLQHNRIVMLTADGDPISETMNCSGGGCEGCPCASNGVDGGSWNTGEPYQENGRFGDGVVREGDKFFASGDSYSAIGDCGIPPIPPIRSRKKAPDKWAEYDKKKAKYDACRAPKKEKHEEKKKDRQEKRHDRKETRKDKKGTKRKGLHTLNKNNPLFVIARNSYRFLVSENMWHMAKNLDAIRKSSPALWKKVEVKWYNLGGDIGKLVSSISIGHNKRTPTEVLQGKKKSADGLEEYTTRYMNNIDGDDTWAVTGAEVATAITSAAGIIAAIKPIIDQFKREKGISDNEEIPTNLGDDGSGGEISNAASHDGVVDEDGAPAPDPSFWDLHKIPIIIGSTILVGFAITIAVVSASRHKAH